MAEHAPFLPACHRVGSKPLHVAFDGGRLTSDAGVLVLAAIERKLGIAERLARCIADPRDPQRVSHSLAEMIRFRALLVAAGYPDGNDCDVLRADPAFKLAVGRLPESGEDLCSQPTMCRLENLPGPTALKRMMAAMVDLFCDSFGQVPRGSCWTSTTARIAFTAVSSWPCSMPTTTAAAFCRSYIYEAGSGKPVGRRSCAPARRRVGPRWRWSCGMSCARSRTIGRRSTSWCAATAIMVGRRRWLGLSAIASATSSASAATRCCSARSGIWPRMPRWRGSGTRATRLPLRPRYAAGLARRAAA